MNQIISQLTSKSTINLSPPKVGWWDYGAKAEFGGMSNQCFYSKQLGHFVQECPKCKDVRKVDNKMQKNMFGILKVEKWIIYYNDEAQFMLVKGEMKMKRVINDGTEMDQTETTKTKYI